MSDVVVVHDDLDLNFGDLRCKLGGGSGGHNGLKSIDSVISNKYWRIRVGIGRPDDKSRVVEHVLSRFTTDEVCRIIEGSKMLCGVVERWLSCGEMRIR